MNGATEATLAELLAVAQAMNANLLTLQRLMSKFTPGTGGGSSGSTGGSSSGLPGPVGIMFKALQGAGNLLSELFSTLGNIIGSTIGQFVNLGSKLYDFSKMAAEGKAKFSDFFEVFNQLPLGVGTLAQLFADMIKYQELLLDVYHNLTESGASFAGSLDDIRAMAARSYLSLDEFQSVVSKNSEVFASAGLNVQAGINKFVDANAKLIGPDSRYQNIIFGMGYTAQQASEMLAGMMKAQGVLGKQNAATTDQLVKLTVDYMTNLDELSKITGKRRDQIDAEVRKAEDDQVWQLYLDSLSPEKAGEVREALASAAAVGGKDLVDVVKNQVRGIDTPLNEASTKIAIATGGMSIEIGAQIRSILASTASSADKSKQITSILGNTAVASVKFADQLGLAGQTIQGEMLPQALIQSGRNIIHGSKTVEKSLEETALDQLKSANSYAANLGVTEQGIKILGMSMMNLVYKAIQPLMPTILNIGLAMVEFISTNLREGSPLYVAVTNVVDWLSKSVDIIKAAFGPNQDWKAAIFATIDRIGSGLSEVWKLVKPAFTQMWEEVKPTLISTFEKIVDFITPYLKKALEVAIDSISDWIYEKTGVGESQQQRMLRQATEQTQQYQNWLDQQKQRLGGHGLQELGIAGWVDRSKTSLFEQYQSDRTVNPEDALKYGRGRRHSGTIGMTGSWWEKSDATLNVAEGESVITPSQMAQIIDTASQSGLSQSLQQLNTINLQILAQLKQTAENTKRTYDATRALGGNLFEMA